MALVGVSLLPSRSLTLDSTQKRRTRPPLAGTGDASGHGALIGTECDWGFGGSELGAAVHLGIHQATAIQQQQYRLVALGFLIANDELAAAGAGFPVNQAYIIARPDSYFAVTKADGTFEIPKLPAGEGTPGTCKENPEVAAALSVAFLAPVCGMGCPIALSVMVVGLTGMKIRRRRRA